MNSLFRPEVQVGGIQTIYRRISFREIASWPIVLTCLTVVTLIIIVLGSLTSRPGALNAVGVVELGSGPLMVEAGRSGLIAGLNVVAGRQVARGQILATINSARAVSQITTNVDQALDVLQSRRRTLEARLADTAAQSQSQERDLRAQIDIEQSGIRTLEAQMPRLRTAAEAARDAVLEYETLAAKGYIRRADQRARELESLARDREIDELTLSIESRRARLTALKGQLVTLRSTSLITSQTIASDRAQVTADYENALATGSAPTLSPTNGRVRAVFVREGEAVHARQAILALDRNSETSIVTVETSAAEAGSIQSGAPVLIRTAQTSAQEARAFRGRVTAVEQFRATATERAGTYAIRVSGIVPMRRGQSLPLPGSRVRVSIANSTIPAPLSGLRRFLGFDDWYHGS